MILAFKHVPAETHSAEPQWVHVGIVPDEAALGALSDGEYAIYTPTKTTVSEGPEAANELPKSFTFDRRVVVSTPEPKPKVTVA